jgi:hypothetical protein
MQCGRQQFWQAPVWTQCEPAVGEKLDMCCKHMASRQQPITDRTSKICHAALFRNAAV